MRKTYPSDINRTQFELIKDELETAKKTTRPRKIDLYEIFCAILYVLKNGITWRALPHDYPDWKLVYYYNTIWGEKNEAGLSVLDCVLTKLREMERYCNGREAAPSMLIADSKTIQNADTAEEKGYDGGKKKAESKSI